MKRLIVLASLLTTPALLQACSVCFSESKYHWGLVLATLFLIPLPALIAYSLIKAAKKTEEEAEK